MSGGPAEWPPDYVRVWQWRQRELEQLHDNPRRVYAAKCFYKTNLATFISHWVDTYDPRNAGGALHDQQRLPARLPFVLFERQIDLIDFLIACLRDEENGLIEKCRDMGASWLLCAASVALWLFYPGVSIGWGSRKEQLVDKLGDPDSLFEKMRLIVLGLPRCFQPQGFNPQKHLLYMRMLNPENGSTITGEAGDNIGRGGRKMIYIKDEAAYFERPEKIEAALADNTRVQIDVSSVNGAGNVFHRRREAGVEWAPGVDIPRGKTRVFVMDWRDHPGKTQTWYDLRRARADEEGLLHVFAQEVDRNYFASLDGVIIDAAWVSAAVDFHVKAPQIAQGGFVAGLDVADGGGDKNALAGRTGGLLGLCAEWGARDTAVSARKALALLAERKITRGSVQYDSIGVGVGVKAELNNLADQKLLPPGITFDGWAAGADVQSPYEHVIPDDKTSPKNEDYFANLKAQAWWSLRQRFYRTWRVVNEGANYPLDSLIALDGTMPLVHKLRKELSQATFKRSQNMKLMVDKAPNGALSPNLADACVMAYFPVLPKNSAPIFGTYGNAR